MQVQPLLTNQVLNINVPDLPLEQLQGLDVTRLGGRHRAETMVKTQDPAGRDIYWLGPPGEKSDSGAGTDFYAVDMGRASLTPILVDVTAYRQLETLSQWSSQLIFNND